MKKMYPMRWQDRLRWKLINWLAGQDTIMINVGEAHIIASDERRVFVGGKSDVTAAVGPERLDWIDRHNLLTPPPWADR